MAQDEDTFIEGDIFDPEMAAYVETKVEERVAKSADDVATFLRRRQQAYTAVFATGNASEDDLKFVMLDLAYFTRAYSPTWNENQKVQDLLEGRREVFMRIMDFTSLDHDTLYRKYTDVTTRK